MLDHEDAAALGGQVAEQLAERVGLGLVLARRRLVEQQQLRVAGQAAGQLEQPGGAGRDRVGPLLGVRRDADPLEQPVDVGRARGGPGRAARGGCRGRPGRCRGRSASRTPRAAGRCGPCPAWRGGAPGCGETLRPLKRTLPRVGFCSPLITLKQVVLPAPFGPIRPVTRPASATNDAWLTAVTPPNCTTTSSTLSSGSVGMRGHPLGLVATSRLAAGSGESSGSPVATRPGSVGRLARIGGAIRRSSQRPSLNS